MHRKLPRQSRQRHYRRGRLETFGRKRPEKAPLQMQLPLWMREENAYKPPDLNCLGASFDEMQPPLSRISVQAAWPVFSKYTPDRGICEGWLRSHVKRSGKPRGLVLRSYMPKRSM